MFDEMEMEPLDSHDLYIMGLRPPRCNGCRYAELKWELGDKFLKKYEAGWIAVYELGAKPSRGQGEFVENEGQPMRHHSSFMTPLKKLRDDRVDRADAPLRG